MDRTRRPQAGKAALMTMVKDEIAILRPGDERALENFLVRHAASSMFLRSNLRQGGLVDRGEIYQATYCALRQGDEIAAVAAHCWNNYVVLQAPQTAGAVAAAAVKASGRPVGGLIGPLAQVAEARIALGLAARPAAVDSKEDLLRLPIVDLNIPAELADGKVACRHTRPDDHALIAEWRIAFAQETLGQRVTPGLGRTSRAEIERLCGDRCLFVLEAAGETVAFCSFNARLPDMVQIGGVYTPPLLRGKGYGRAIVAAALQIAQTEGVAEAILFTGRDNAPAQEVYRALGFTRVGDYALVLLDD